MKATTTSWMRTLGTFGIAAAGPVALVMMAATLATLWRGTPGWVAAGLVISGSVTVFSIVLYLVADIQERFGPGS